MFSARSRDFKHLNGWATKTAEPNEDGKHVSDLKEPDEGPEESRKHERGYHQMNRQAGQRLVQGSTTGQVWVRFGGKTGPIEVVEETAGRLEERKRDMTDLGTETEVYLVSEGGRADSEDWVRMEEVKMTDFICRTKRGGKRKKEGKGKGERERERQRRRGRTLGTQGRANLRNPNREKVWWRQGNLGRVGGEVERGWTDGGQVCRNGGVGGTGRWREREKQLGNDGEIIPNEVGPVERKIGVLNARWKLEKRTERNEEGGSDGRGKDKAILSTGERAG